MRPVETLVWEKISDQEGLSEVAHDLVEQFHHSKDRCLCVWLEGPLGAGKTTLCGAMLHNMGLSSKVPVTSPTYAYLNEYELGKDIWAHMDLYRLPAGSGLEELGVEPDHHFRGMFVEWPEKVSDTSLIIPDFILRVNREDDPGRRRYQLFKIGVK